MYIFDYLNGSSISVASSEKEVREMLKSFKENPPVFTDKKLPICFGLLRIRKIKAGEWIGVDHKQAEDVTHQFIERQTKKVPSKSNQLIGKAITLRNVYPSNASVVCTVSSKLTLEEAIVHAANEGMLFGRGSWGKGDQYCYGITGPFKLEPVLEDVEIFVLI